MARPLRIELSGGLYHVTSRGDRREEIFHDAGDRKAWLEIFGKACKRHNWVCHAYCLMSNHYHVVVETPEANLSRGMRQLNGVYTQYVNRTHSRVGHVFQGRFKGILVEKDSYLVELARYVVLNPVRAGMVADARDWRWSSHLALLGEAAKPEWLKTEWILGQFGVQKRRATAKYEDFVRAGMGLPSIWDELKSQVFLGGTGFVQRMQERIPPAETVREIPRAQRRPPAKPLADYEGDGRNGMALAYLSGDYSLQQIAVHFGVHYSTVSRAVRAHEERGRDDKTPGGRMAG